jgi:hypothetical protein
MEDNVKKLEEILGEKFEDWTEPTLGKMLKTEEAIKLFTPEMVVHLLLTRKNDKIIEVLVPIKYGYDLRAIKAKIEEQLIELKEKNKPLEDYKNEILKYSKMDNPIFKIAVYLTALATFGPDYDLSKEEPEIRKSISNFKKILLGLKLDEGFQVITELLDLLFPFRELYSQRYKVDLLKDDKELETFIDTVNERVKMIIDFAKHMEEQHAKEEGYQTETDGETHKEE